MERIRIGVFGKNGARETDSEPLDPNATTNGYLHAEVTIPVPKVVYDAATKVVKSVESIVKR